MQEPSSNKGTKRATPSNQQGTTRKAATKGDRATAKTNLRSNNLKPSVYSYLPQYDDLSIEKKMALDKDEHFDRMQIRISCFLD